VNILIYGAGMIGSIIASQLERNGQKVTILARGSRAEAIRSFGIVTHPLEGDDYHTAHPAVIETLKPEDDFDVILVTLRRNQHHEILPILAQNQHAKTILFLGNNLGSAVDLAEYLPAEKIVLGFGGTGGERRGDILYHFCDERSGKVGKIWLGELDGKRTQRLQQLAQLFQQSGFDTEIQPHMDDWLKTHAALILPLAFGLYRCEGNNYHLAQTRDALLMVFRAIREGFRVVHKTGSRLTPVKFALMARLPEPIAVAILRKLFASETARIGIAVHANNARDEMYFLAREFQALMQSTAVATPNLAQLFAIIDADQPAIPQGSKTTRLNWKPVLIAAGIFAGILGALGYLFGQRKRKP
jgi:2-dehydropantoate 2-reductase